MAKVIKIDSNNISALKTDLTEALNSGKATVTFTKKDGSKRVMTCTTSTSLIPVSGTPGTSTRAKNPDAVPVYDLDLGEWRSFRWDSVISAEVVDV